MLVVQRRPIGRRVREGIGDLGAAHWLRGVLRRRLGLVWVRACHRRLVAQRGCDIRRGVRLRLGPNGRVVLGAECVIDEGSVVECRGRLEIGDRTVIAHHCTVAVADSVVIGSDCLIGELVSIRDHEHEFRIPDLAMIDQGRRTDPVRIGRDVWLGAKVTVTSGVTIGDGTIVGANAVVTADLPAGVIAAGVPARVIRSRTSEEVQGDDLGGGNPTG